MLMSRSQPTITHLLNQLIQDNSANTTPTASSRAHCSHTESWLDRETGASRISPDSHLYVKNTSVILILTVIQVARNANVSEGKC